jgi:Tfp pilus assembly protein PilZ
MRPDLSLWVNYCYAALFWSYMIRLESGFIFIQTRAQADSLIDG